MSGAGLTSRRQAPYSNIRKDRSQGERLAAGAGSLDGGAQGPFEPARRRGQQGSVEPRSTGDRLGHSTCDWQLASTVINWGQAIDRMVGATGIEPVTPAV